ncbi:unnamed protein product, partial [Rotaria sordida]
TCALCSAKDNLLDTDSAYVVAGAAGTNEYIDDEVVLNNCC